MLLSMLFIIIALVLLSLEAYHIWFAKRTIDGEGPETNIFEMYKAIAGTGFAFLSHAAYVFSTSPQATKELGTIAIAAIGISLIVASAVIFARR